MSGDRDAFGHTVKEVISYRDDVYVWVYLDQLDRVIRYEAYVVGYDESGRQTTLDFVLEEGVLDTMHEIPLFCDLLRAFQTRSAYAHPGIGTYSFTVDGRLVAPTPLKHFYAALDDDELHAVHTFFCDREEQLKAERKTRWTRMLRALGYDVISSL